MFDYWRFMSVDQLLLLGGLLVMVPFMAWPAWLQKKYSVPFPPPRPLPDPLPEGWASFLISLGTSLIPFGCAVLIAAHRYCVHLSALEKTGGSIAIWSPFAMAYDFAGTTGILVLGFLIAGVIWYVAFDTIRKGWTS